jgi:hypothetical protein
MADPIGNAMEPERSVSLPVKEPPSNLPFVITLAALLFFFGFQTVSLFTERANLSMVKSNQEGALQEAERVQSQFKILLTKTSELADQGHAGAKLIMDGLQKQGVGFAPDSGPTKAGTKGSP